MKSRLILIQQEKNPGTILKVLSVTMSLHQALHELFKPVPDEHESHMQYYFEQDNDPDPRTTKLMGEGPVTTNQMAGEMTAAATNQTLSDL